MSDLDEQTVAAATIVTTEVTVTTNDVEPEVVADGTVGPPPAKKRSAPKDDEESDGPKRRKTTTTTAGSTSLLSYFKPQASGSKVAPAVSEPEEDEDDEPSASLTSEPTGEISITELVKNLEQKTLAKDWRDALEAEFTKPYFRNLKAFLEAEYRTQTIYPAARDVYSWSRYVRLKGVKVVVLGQDPYHQPGQAHGLSFSVKEPTVPPPSLKNIYKQIALEYPDSFKVPKTGDLSPIARQGVLWLNSSLTVRRGAAASHSKKGWETFTTAVLKAILARKNAKGVVFMAWGAHAQRVCREIKIDTKKHLVLQSAHPSPLSAHNGFIGNGHFKKTNDWLAETYGVESQIDWTVLNA